MEPESGTGSKETHVQVHLSSESIQKIGFNFWMFEVSIKSGYGDLKRHPRSIADIDAMFWRGRVPCSGETGCHVLARQGVGCHVLMRQGAGCYVLVRQGAACHVLARQGAYSTFLKILWIFVYIIIIITNYFFFHSLLGLDVCPRVKKQPLATLNKNQWTSQRLAVVHPSMGIGASFWWPLRNLSSGIVEFCFRTR